MGVVYITAMLTAMAVVFVRWFSEGREVALFEEPLGLEPAGE